MSHLHPRCLNPPAPCLKSISILFQSIKSIVDVCGYRVLGAYFPCADVVYAVVVAHEVVPDLRDPDVSAAGALFD